MANRISPRPPFSATAPPPPPPPRWWSLEQLRSLLRREENTEEETSALSEPLQYAFITWITIFSIILFFIFFPCHVSFTVESISHSPSDTWQVNFLVKKPCSWCLVHYDGGEVYAKLGYLNAAVLKTSPTNVTLSKYTRFSVDLATELNQSNVVVASSKVFELNMKLGAKKHPLSEYFNDDEDGYFDIKCRNLSLDSLNIKCHSSFKSSDILKGHL